VTRVRYLLLTVAVAVASPWLRAQDASDIEMKPYGSYIGGSIDTVDLATGNLFLKIPLISYPQLGKLPPLSFSIELNNAPYSQSLYNFGDLDCSNYFSNCAYITNRYNTAPPGAALLYPIPEPGQGVQPNVIGAYVTSSLEGPVVTGKFMYLPGSSAREIPYTLVDPSGTTHELESDSQNAVLYHAPDGSGFTFIPDGSGNAGDFFDPENEQFYLTCPYGTTLSNTYWNAFNYSYGYENAIRTGTVLSADGTQYVTSFSQNSSVPNGCSQPSTFLTTTVTDVTGNNHITRGPWGWGDKFAAYNYYTGDTSHQSYYVDSVGRTIPDPISMEQVIATQNSYSTISPAPLYGTGEGAATCPVVGNVESGGTPWVVPGPDGGTLTFTFCYTYSTYSYSFPGIPGASPWCLEGYVPLCSPGSPAIPVDGPSGGGIELVAVVLPDKQSYWGFVYGDGGTLSQVIFPTGASISYTNTYAPLLNQCGLYCIVVNSRTENDGLGNMARTDYNYANVTAAEVAGGPTPVPTETTTESRYLTQQFGASRTWFDVVHTFTTIGGISLPSEIPGYPGPTDYATAMYETQTQVFQGPSATTVPVKTTATSYDYVWDLDPLTGGSTASNMQGGISRITNVVPASITTSGPGGVTSIVTRKYLNDTAQGLFKLSRWGCLQGSNGSPDTCAAIGAYFVEGAGQFPYEPQVNYIRPTLEAENNPGNPSTTLRASGSQFLFQAQPRYLGANIIAPVAQTWVANSGGVQAASTSYVYDGGSSSLTQGFLTATTHNLLNSSGAVLSNSPTTSIGYSSVGMPNLTTDANGNQSYVLAFQCNGLFPATTIRAYQSTTTTPETTTAVNDCSTGHLETSTDANGVLRHLTYNDSLARVTEIQNAWTSPIEADTAVTYSGLTQASTASDQSATGDGVLDKTSVYDGLGRVIHQSNTAGSIVDTTYNTTGQVASVSNPYPTGGTPGVFTYFYYDSLGRKIQEIEQDGSTLWWCYDGLADIRIPQPNCSPRANKNGVGVSWVDTTDERGVHRQQVTNSLGQLIAVMEPDPQTGGAPFLETDYTYDVLNNLHSVSQLGNGTTEASRGRSFIYDSLSRLVQSYNPETGYICYGTTPGNTAPNGTNCTEGYDGNGNLLSKTDARGVVVAYSYDALNRLKSKTYIGDQSASPSSCYLYDSSAVSYGVGRLAAQWTQKGPCGSSPGSSSLTQTSVSAYDQLGRITSQVRCVLTSCTTDYPGQATYSYNIAGQLTNYSDGIGTHLFTNSYDSAGRLSTVTTNWIDTVHPPTLFSAQSYTPSGALASAVYGNNLTLTRTYDLRLRITGETDISSIGQSPAIPVTIGITGVEKTIP